MANIGYDIDGVLTDVEAFQIKYGTKYFKRAPINENGYGIKEMFDCSEKEEYKFWAKYTLLYFLTSPRKDAAKTIQKLKNDGNKVISITSRAKTTEKGLSASIMRFLTKGYLIINRIPFDDIVYCSVEESQNEKKAACIKHSINYMIEDKKENIETLSSVTKVLKFQTNNNSDYKNDNVQEVDTFNKIFNFIKVDIIKNKQDYFKFLNEEEKKHLSNEELITYYKNLKDYYLNSSFDKKKFEKGEKGCKLVFKIMQPFFDIMYNPITLNKDKFPKENGVIYVSNHLHALDPLVIMNSVRGKTFHLLAKEDLESGALGTLFKGVGSVFLNEKDENSKYLATEEIITILLKDGNVMMFPEGHRNKTNKNLQPFQYGAVSFARKTGKPLIPFSITDNYVLGGNKLIANVGDPINVGYDDNLKEANEKLKNSIEKLMEENNEYMKMQESKENVNNKMLIKNIDKVSIKR